MAKLKQGINYKYAKNKNAKYQAINSKYSYSKRTKTGTTKKYAYTKRIKLANGKYRYYYS